MSPYPNLILDSLLVNETIKLLKSSGGIASVVEVVDQVMNIKSPEPGLAKMLVSDLIKNNPRFQLNGDKVKLVKNYFGNRRLDQTEFVVFDLETTGTKSFCRVIEIGAYRVRNYQIVDEFQTLVNPEILIPKFITKLTNINDKMVRDAPKFTEIISDFMEFIGDSVLVAHNASFDMRFLNYEISRIYSNRRLANFYLCTVSLSRKLLPSIENHRLKTVANYYSIDLNNHHRASADALATAKIFIKSLENLDEKVIEGLVRT